MTVYLVLIGPTPADLTLAGRIAGTGQIGRNVQITPIHQTSSGPLVAGAYAEIGLRYEVDRTVRRRPRPKRRIAPRVADLHRAAGTVPR